MSFGPFAVGLGKGYTSPALASLLPNENSDQIPAFSSHLPNIKITHQEGSWIASLSLLGKVLFDRETILMIAGIFVYGQFNFKYLLYKVVIDG